MAGFDPNQPRDKEGQWTKAASSARGAAFGARDFLARVDSRPDVMRNPFDPRAVAFLTDDMRDVQANVELQDYTNLMLDKRPTIYMNITVPENNRRKGFGKTVMQKLIGIAEETGVELRGTPSAFGSGKKMSTSQLYKWYQSLGFIVEEESGDVVYKKRRS